MSDEYTKLKHIVAHVIADYHVRQYCSRSWNHFRLEYAKIVNELYDLDDEELISRYKKGNILQAVCP